MKMKMEAMKMETGNLTEVMERKGKLLSLRIAETMDISNGRTRRQREHDLPGLSLNRE